MGDHVVLAPPQNLGVLGPEASISESSAAKQAWRCMPIIPATLGAEGEVSLFPG